MERVRSTWERLSAEARSRLPSYSGWRPKGRTLRGLVGFIVAIVVLYYPVGMALTHRIDDDVNFKAPAKFQAKGASRSVAITAALIEREIEVQRWTANDPFFLPPAALDNMPNYQQGIISALARFAFELTDQIGRTRGSSQTDPDLQEAAGQLQYAGNIWVFDLSTSIAPTTTSEARYNKAMRSLMRYNRRLADGAAVFERRADNLLATVDRIALDLGASSAAIEKHIAEKSGNLLDLDVDDLFYGVKGQTYAYYLVLRELATDFAKVIAERELANAWMQMLDSLRAAAELSPWVVVDGDPDGQMLPNHLAGQGFYLLRARTKLKEISNILLK